MKIRNNIFNKMMIMVLLLLLPIVFLYTYSNKISVNVVEEEIESSNMNHLAFFLGQVESKLVQFNTIASILSRDSSVNDFINIDLIDSASEQIEVKKMIIEKMSLQSASSDWSNQISLYSLESEEVISTRLLPFEREQMLNHFTQDWEYRTSIIDGQAAAHFVRHTAYPINASRNNIKDARLIIETVFSADNLQNMLDQFKSGREGDPFLYHPEQGLIVNRSGQDELVALVAGHLDRERLADKGKLTRDLAGENYLINYVQSAELGWYLVDYLPVQEALSPITTSRNLFYSSIALLLTMSVLAALLLYRNVRVPIRELLRAVHRLKMGDYSVRMSYKFNNEFDYLFTRFNDMTNETQELIEKVYAEKLRSREATLKQLQAQINPHFLYNCLFFIKNMTKLGDDEAVIKMTLYLGEYYRYTTRLEKQTATIEEEMLLIANYLAIQNLRMKRIEYEIDIPEEMMKMEIPRLLLQPIVENAIVHGIELKPGAGMIRIVGEQDEREVRLIVDDNGLGIPPEKLQELLRKLNMPIQEEMGFGVWNVHQRLIYHFGKDAGMEMMPLSPEGLRVILRWPIAP